MKYRSRTDIAAEVLKSASGGETTKTKIMYMAFLSYAQLKEYLLALTENGLLAYDKSAQKYRTTEKGHRFLKTVEEMGELTDIPQQQQQEYKARQQLKAR